MSRYIDAEKLMELSTITRTYKGDSCITVDDVDDCPTEDVAPIKHGKWREGCSGNGITVPVSKYYICDQCHCVSRKKTRYCPHCGAMMDKEKSKLPSCSPAKDAKSSDTVKDIKEPLFRECALWESAYKYYRKVSGENHESTIAAEHKFQALYDVIEDADLDGEYAQWKEQDTKKGK